MPGTLDVAFSCVPLSALPKVMSAGFAQVIAGDGLAVNFAWMLAGPDKVIVVLALAGFAITALPLTRIHPAKMEPEAGVAVIVCAEVFER